MKCCAASVLFLFLSGLPHTVRCFAISDHSHTPIQCRICTRIYNLSQCNLLRIRCFSLARSLLSLVSSHTKTLAQCHAFFPFCSLSYIRSLSSSRGGPCSCRQSRPRKVSDPAKETKEFMRSTTSYTQARSDTEARSTVTRQPRPTDMRQAGPTNIRQARPTYLRVVETS